MLIEIAPGEDSVVVHVQDYGVGIPKQPLDKIFERFYRVYGTQRTFPGLGIGLYIVYDIVNRHGGEVWVESPEGKGSTFSFSLPLSSEGSTSVNNKIS